MRPQVYLKPDVSMDAKSVAVLPFIVQFPTAIKDGSFVTKPFGFGFDSAGEELTAYAKNVPQTMEEKEKLWFGSHEKVRLFVTPAVAVRMARTCSLDFHKFLKRKGWYDRVVDPDSVLAEIQNLGLKEKLQLSSWEDLRSPAMQPLLKKLGLSLGTDLLIVGVVNQYETDVIKRVRLASEKAARGHVVTSDQIDYSYSQKLGMEVAIFDVMRSRWLWRAGQSRSVAQRSGDVKQDLALASATGAWNNFVANWLLDTITENSPQEMCVKDLLKLYPR